MHGNGRRPRLENLPPPFPLGPNAILLRPEGLHPLGELVFQLGPVVVFKLHLGIHLEINVAVPRRGHGRLVEFVLVLLTGAVGAVVAIAVDFNGLARDGRAECLLGDARGIGAFDGVLRGGAGALKVEHGSDGLGGHGRVDGLGRRCGMKRGKVGGDGASASASGSGGNFLLLAHEAVHGCVDTLSARFMPETTIR